MILNNSGHVSIWSSLLALNMLHYFVYINSSTAEISIVARKWEKQPLQHHFEQVNLAAVPRPQGASGHLDRSQSPLFSSHPKCLSCGQVYWL